MNFIDINCDVGEGVTNESKLFTLISSCNIACGGHIGNAKTIDDSIALAKRYNVKIGAHPSFPDQENFGRKLIKISNEELTKSLQSQLNLFLDRVSVANVKLHHIKPHGALYNAIKTDIGLAKIFVKSIKKYLKKDSFLYVPWQSKIEGIAIENAIPIKYEAFADRNYNENGSLLSRSYKDAVIQEPIEVLNHILRIIKKKEVKAVNGKILPLIADTFCIHGDNNNALPILEYLHIYLKRKEIVIK